MISMDATRQIKKHKIHYDKINRNRLRFPLPGCMPTQGQLISLKASIIWIEIFFAQFYAN